MKRAVVAIGVDKTGNLPELNDAAKGARRFAKWARSQGMDPVKVITDQRSKVTLQQIKDAIAEIVDKGTAEQLLVYFAGHGVNIRYGEYWLLSDAPRDTQAAVNVSGSVTLAKYCGIPHVVLISDACRTAAEGVQAQFVMGGEIFPNEGVDDLGKPVDQFFACTLGRPAHEIKNPNITAHEYKGLYTQALLDALQGTPSEVVDWVDESTGYVRPWALKRHLYEAVSQKIAQLGLQTKVVQIPDAQITSPDSAWLAILDKDSIKRKRRRTRSELARPLAHLPKSATEISQSLLSSALSGDSPERITDLAREQGVDPTGDDRFTDILDSTAAPFGATHHETQCGFKIRGAQFASAFALRANVQQPGSPTDDLRAEVTDGTHANVLLTLDSGAGIVLPAISGFLCALTVDGDELVSVAYEPSDNTDRWPQFEQRADEVRTLRAVAAASTRNGSFRLDEEGALELARRMQYAKGVDPALAIYAAYAYQDLRRKDLITGMAGYMQDDLGAHFFDLALLVGELRDCTAGEDPNVMGSMPLLAQGWAQLSAHRVKLPDPLLGIERFLSESPWTMFTGDGATMVRNAIERGVVK